MRIYLIVMFVIWSIEGFGRICFLATNDYPRKKEVRLGVECGETIVAGFMMAWAAYLIWR